jgi:hypothetical protein
LEADLEVVESFLEVLYFLETLKVGVDGLCLIEVHNGLLVLFEVGLGCGSIKE